MEKNHFTVEVEIKYRGPERRLTQRQDSPSQDEIIGYIARMIREGTSFEKGVTPADSHNLKVRNLAKAKTLEVLKTLYGKSLETEDIELYNSTEDSLCRKFKVKPYSKEPPENTETERAIREAAINLVKSSRTTIAEARLEIRGMVTAKLISLFNEEIPERRSRSGDF